MAVCIIQDWPETETERATPTYDAVTAIVQSQAEAAQGFVVHAAGWTGNGFRIIEIWESMEGFERFLREVVMPAVEQVRQSSGRGTEPPQVTSFELHNLVTA